MASSDLDYATLSASISALSLGTTAFSLAPPDRGTDGGSESGSTDGDSDASDDIAGGDGGSARGRTPRRRRSGGRRKPVDASAEWAARRESEAVRRTAQLRAMEVCQGGVCVCVCVCVCLRRGSRLALG